MFSNFTYQDQIFAVAIVTMCAMAVVVVLILKAQGRLKQ